MEGEGALRVGNHGMNLRNLGVDLDCFALNCHLRIYLGPSAKLQRPTPTTPLYTPCRGNFSWNTYPRIVSISLIARRGAFSAMKVDLSLEKSIIRIFSSFWTNVGLRFLRLRRPFQKGRVIGVLPRLDEALQGFVRFPVDLRIEPIWIKFDLGRFPRAFLSSLEHSISVKDGSTLSKLLGAFGLERIGYIMVSPVDGRLDGCLRNLEAGPYVVDVDEVERLASLRKAFEHPAKLRISGFVQGLLPSLCVSDVVELLVGKTLKLFWERRRNGP